MPKGMEELRLVRHHGFDSPVGVVTNYSYVFLFYCKYLNSCSSTLAKQNINAVDLLSLRDPGPWGGPGGNQWDDGVFAAVQKVHLYIGHGWIHAIQVECMKRDGKNIWSPMHGTPRGELVSASTLFFFDCLNAVMNIKVDFMSRRTDTKSSLLILLTSPSL